MLKALGARIEEAMALREWTQGQLELRSGVSQQHISLIINGRRMPRADKLLALARALEVSADWLLGLSPRTPGSLTPEEDTLLTEFRALGSDEARHHILTVIKSLQEV
jgi:transcriptional regulator with XRE-family HTH domain